MSTHFWRCTTALLVSAFLLYWPSAHGADIPWIWHSSDAPAHAQEIAVLLDHLQLSGDGIAIRQRRKMLLVDKATRVTPVVHVQSDPKNMPNLGPRQTEAIVQAVQAASLRSTSGWVQLDFEALESQRDYYVRLVSTLRNRLAPSIQFSVTVMAGWCAHKGLLAQLRADEVVPMFFHMGPQADTYRARLQRKPDQFDPRCRQQAAGFAVQEKPALEVQRRYDRRYWFNYQAWNNFSMGD